MYGNTAVIRKRAGQLRDQALDIRATADQLVAQAEATPWRGRAAEALRTRVRERATQLREAAAEHDRAADSLDKHAHDVDAAKDAINRLERRAETLVADAAERLSVGSDPDSDDEALTRAELPPSGHRDWLTVELPGL